MTGLLTNTSLFDGAMDDFQDWQNGVTEVLASPLNHLSDAIESTEQALLQRFGADATYRPITTAEGNVIMPTNVTVAEAFANEVRFYGLMPFIISGNLTLLATVRYPHTRDAAHATVTFDGVEIYWNGVSQTGWTISVLASSADDFRFQAVKAVNGTDTTQMATGGYFLIFTYHVA